MTYYYNNNNKYKTGLGNLHRLIDPINHVPRHARGWGVEGWGRKTKDEKNRKSCSSPPSLLKHGWRRERDKFA